MPDVVSDHAPTDSLNARTIDTGQTFDTRSALRAQYSLFLSYHSADRAIVKLLADALQEAAELPPWFDEWDVAPGADWRPAIARALGACKAFAAVLGPTGWGPIQRDEVAEAIRLSNGASAVRGANVFPVLLPGSDPNLLKLFEPHLLEKSWVRLGTNTAQELDTADAVLKLLCAIDGVPLSSKHPRIRMIPLRTAAGRWEQSSRRDASLLFSGEQLRLARELQKDHADYMKPLEVAFIAAAESQARRRQLTGWTLLVVAILLVGLSLLAYNQRQAQAHLARSAETRAEVRRLQRIAASTQWPERRALVLLEALSRNNSNADQEPSIEESLRRSLDQMFNSIPLRSPKLSAQALSNDGRWVATGGSDGSVRLFSLERFDASPMRLDRGTHGIAQLTFSPDVRWLAAGGEDLSYLQDPPISGKVHLWRLESATFTPFELDLDGNEARDLQFSPDSRYLAVLDTTGRVLLAPLSLDHSALSHPRIQAQGAVAIRFSGSGEWLAVGGSDGHARLWRVASLENDAVMLGPHDDREVLNLTFSPDSQWLLTTSSDGVLPRTTSRSGYLWWLGSEPPLKRELFIRNTFHAVRQASFSNDSRWLLMRAEHHDLRVFAIPETPSGHVMDFTLTGHVGDITAAAFVPGGTTIATTSDDKTVRLWTQNGDTFVSTTLLGHTDAVRAVVWSQNGTNLFTAGDDMTVRNWDALDLTQPPQVLIGHEGGVSSLALPSNRSALLSSSFEVQTVGGRGDETMRLYPLRAGSEALQPQTLGIVSDNWLSVSPKGGWLSSWGKTIVPILSGSLGTPVDVDGESSPTPLFADNDDWFLARFSGGVRAIRLADRRTFDLTSGTSSRLPADIDGIQADPTAHWAAVALATGEILLYDLSAASPATSVRAFAPMDRGDASSRITDQALSFAEDGRWLLVITKFASHPAHSEPDAAVARLIDVVGGHAQYSLSIDGFVPQSGIVRSNRVLISSVSGGLSIWELPFTAARMPIRGEVPPASSAVQQNNLFVSQTNSGALLVATQSAERTFLWEFEPGAHSLRYAEVAQGKPNGIGGSYSAWQGAEFLPGGSWLALYTKHDREAGDNCQALQGVQLLNLSHIGEKVVSLHCAPGDSAALVRHSPDGRWLAAGGAESLSRETEHTGIRLWNLSDRIRVDPEPMRLLAHDTTVTDFAFSSAGYFFSASRDNHIVEWSLLGTSPPSTAVTIQAAGPAQFLDTSHLHALPDGQMLLVTPKAGAARDGVTLVRKVTAGRSGLDVLARRSVGRNMRLEEWHRYIGGAPCRKIFSDLDGCAP